MYPTVIPTREQFVAAAAAGRRIPVAIRRLADLETPISLYQKVRTWQALQSPRAARPISLSSEAASGAAAAVPGSFLLESAAGPAPAGGEGGRYSFLGVTFQRLVLRQGRFFVEGSAYGGNGNKDEHPSLAGRSQPHSGNPALRTIKTSSPSGGRPWEFVRQLGHEQRVSRDRLPPLPPFLGGLVGYIGYDAVRTLEKVPDLGHPGLPIPDACLLFTDVVLAFDHAEQSLWVLAIPETAPDSPSDPGYPYDQTLQRLQRFLAELAALPAPSYPPDCSATGVAESASPPSNADTGLNGGWSSSFSREEYGRAVRLAQQHIQAGDIFQVVLSQRLVGPAPDSLDFYRALRMANPSPYLFHLDFGTFQVAGSSPEVMVRLQGDQAQVRPIAGTRPRGRTPQQQQELETQLRTDPKEQAEHVMLVDLGRNDLGRVCRFGTVHVPERLVIERYSHVCHLVSQVEGRLRPDKDAIDLLQATFPAGTVSGAPKVRAMEIIESLEPVRRGVYAGAVGYLGWDGNLDTCIAIRTGVIVDNQLYVQAGAGIVADSVPEREYQETLQKAAALLRTAELLAVRG